jgi:alcohol dehydrogenase (NADP+)
MVYPDSWKGFQIEDPAKWTEFHLNELKPKPFGDFDVDIKIQACGVCASDLHTVSGGWGEQHFPLCVGHGEFGFALMVRGAKFCFPIFPELKMRVCSVLHLN